MKKTLFLFLFTIVTVIGAKAQTADDAKVDTIDIPSEMPRQIDTKVMVFTAVESEPKFPGGMQEFYKYLGNSINVPASLFVKGRVQVSFVVETDGQVVETKIIKGIVTQKMKQEILRVFNASPKWKPAIQNGRPVRVQYSIPLSF
ncbi:energy transducer TonB [Mucilaginibacter ginsenosidivorans]|uniref:TonB C-terminal domain-containing protein n=1 Tax=Mucilaginibacter ginsenosidivorans TaxID=398053 RepID=A0A5B8UZ70_9SPHI|nr:energy transducer TonB [Mucilaginibacter ginsenosidivorans]QEC64450.1 hypothetical protein FRZ54_18335 [Mucilaginibacter ginsenosidivorans]